MLIKRKALKIESIDEGGFLNYLEDFVGTYIKEVMPDVEYGVLITKKSYLSLDVLNAIPQDIKWYSDRYFTKLTDFSEFKGKKIAIIDDTVNTAYNFRNFFDMMTRNCGSGDNNNPNVIPFVLLMNENYYFGSNEKCVGKMTVNP